MAPEIIYQSLERDGEFRVAGAPGEEVATDTVEAFLVRAESKNHVSIDPQPALKMPRVPVPAVNLIGRGIGNGAWLR